MSMFSMPPSEIIILSANNYDKEDVSGCSVFYTFDTTMQETRDDINTIGNIPAKVWGPKELFQQIICAPAKYAAEFTMRIKKNVPTLYLSSVRYLNSVRLVDEVPAFYGTVDDAPGEVQDPGGIPAGDTAPIADAAPAGDAPPAAPSGTGRRKQQA